MKSKFLLILLVICVIPAASLIFLAMYQGVNMSGMFILVIIILIVKNRHRGAGGKIFKFSNGEVDGNNHLRYLVSVAKKERREKVNLFLKSPWEWIDDLHADIISVDGIKGTILFDEMGEIKKIILSNGKTIRAKKVLPDKQIVKDYYLDLVTPKIQELIKYINNEGGSYTFNIVDFEGKKNSARDRKLFVEVLEEIGFIPELNGLEVTITENV